MMISLVWICIVCFALDKINVSTADELETPSCTFKWVEVPDVYSLGATFQIKETLKSCRDACIKRVPGCTAVDVHGNFTNCFTHTQSLPNLEKNRIPFKGYTQLVLTKECASPTLPPPAETTVQSFTEAVQSNPQSSSETDKSAPCTVRWLAVDDVYSLGSKFRYDITDLDQCKDTCIKNINSCVAVDVHGHYPYCFLHFQTLSNVVKKRIAFKGYTQLVLNQECPATLS